MCFQPKLPFFPARAVPQSNWSGEELTEKEMRTPSANLRVGEEERHRHRDFSYSGNSLTAKVQNSAETSVGQTDNNHDLIL